MAKANQKKGIFLGSKMFGPHFFKNSYFPEIVSNRSEPSPNELALILDKG